MVSGLMSISSWYRRLEHCTSIGGDRQGCWQVSNFRTFWRCEVMIGAPYNEFVLKA